MARQFSIFKELGSWKLARVFGLRPRAVIDEQAQGITLPTPRALPRGALGKPFEEGMDESLRVAVRLRGESRRASSAASTGDGLHGCVHLEGGKTITLVPSRSKENDTGKPAQFEFDRVLGPDAEQKEVFELVQPLVSSVIQGYNATVFAYGQTGSGKTHTIMGPVGPSQSSDLSPSDAKRLNGICPRMVAKLFEDVNAYSSSHPNELCLIQLSVVELYQNSFRDLLENVPRARAMVSRQTGHAGESIKRRAIALLERGMMMRQFSTGLPCPLLLSNSPSAFVHTPLNTMKVSPCPSTSSHLRQIKSAFESIQFAACILKDLRL